MHKSHIQKYLGPPKECEICGGKFKIEKHMNDSVTKRHENRIVEFIVNM